MNSKNKKIKGTLESCKKALEKIREYQEHKINGTLDQLIDYDAEWEELFKDDNNTQHKPKS